MQSAIHPTILHDGAWRASAVVDYIADKLRTDEQLCPYALTLSVRIFARAEEKLFD